MPCPYGVALGCRLDQTQEREQISGLGCCCCLHGSSFSARSGVGLWIGVRGRAVVVQAVVLDEFGEVLAAYVLYRCGLHRWLSRDVINHFHEVVRRDVASGVEQLENRDVEGSRETLEGD